MRGILVDCTKDPFHSDFDGLIKDHRRVGQTHAPSSDVMEAKMGWNEGVPAPASRRQQIVKSSKMDREIRSKSLIVK
jgi:hypothetical protein